MDGGDEQQRGKVDARQTFTFSYLCVCMCVCIFLLRNDYSLWQAFALLQAKQMKRKPQKDFIPADPSNKKARLKK